MDNIFLTGGTGFFGVSLLRHWQHLGAQAPRLTVLSRDPARFAAKHPELATLAHWVPGDILKPASLPQGQRFSHILHGATDSTLGPQLSPLERYEQIVEGTRNVLDFAVSVEAPRFLLTSSGGVYGYQPQSMEKIPETYNGIPDPLKAHNTYSIAKRAAEHLCALYQDKHGIKTVIARCFAFVGRDLPLDAHFAIGNFIRDALWAESITVHGDGTPLRSYMDQRDLSEWLLALLLHGKSGEAYNVGSDQAVCIADLAHRVRDLLSPGKPVHILSQALSHGERNRYIPDIDKCKQHLGLNLRYPLDQSIVDAGRGAVERHEHIQPTT